jgi:hypothetical protein
MEASGSEQGTLAGVSMRHIAVVQSMNKVLLKGIAHVDRRFLLACYEDKSEEAEVDLEVERLVRELMMEKWAAGTRVWILIAQLQDGQWAGFYLSGLGNNPHKKIAIKWSEGFSSHIRFHLLHQGFEAADINSLIRGAFNFKAAKEAAKAAVGRDRKIMSQNQAIMERMLKDQGKNMTWADITLGMTTKQLKEHDKELVAAARPEEELEHDYNFEEGHSINPGKGRNDDGTAATLAMRVSLGNMEYDIVDGDDASYLSNLAENLYKDNNHCKDIDIKIAAVHHNTGCALVPPDLGGKGTEPNMSINDNEEMEDQSDIPDKHMGMQGGDEQSATQSSQLSADLASTTIHANKAQHTHGGAGFQLWQEGVCLGEQITQRGWSLAHGARRVGRFRARGETHTINKLNHNNIIKRIGYKPDKQTR